jgi:hypothetical protein
VIVLLVGALILGSGADKPQALTMTVVAANLMAAGYFLTRGGILVMFRIPKVQLAFDW